MQMQKMDAGKMAMAGLAMATAAGAVGLWAAGSNSRRPAKKMAKKAAHTAEKAVMGLDRLMRERKM